MIDRDKVTELLKNYRSYKYAVRMYEQSKGIPCAGIAVYDDMPRSSSFGSRAPRMNDGISLEDTIDYRTYKSAVNAIEGAMDTLKRDERNVIEYKWIHGLTLEKIDERFHYGRGYARQIHRRALQHMAICLRFTDAPQIQEVKQVVNI